MPTKQGLGARLRRSLGFFHKEVLGVLHQPRLVTTLVVAPFLILFIFGLGYRETPAPFETVLVLGSEEAQLAADLDDLREAFANIELHGVVTDPDEAMDRLESGDLDLLIIAPEDPLAALDQDEQAMFTVLHREVDTVIRANIRLIAKLSVDEINRKVLEQVVTSAQEESEEIQGPIADLRSSASQLVLSLESGDRSEADEQIEQLRRELEVAEERTGSTGNLYSSVADALGQNHDGLFSELRTDLEGTQSSDQDTALDSARDLEDSLMELENQLANAQELDPVLLVSPFGVETRQIQGVTETPALIYAPGTMVLLMQHLALTFGALSLVRERQLNLTELFRVSPLTPTEAVAGKYLGFLAISGVVALALTGALLIFGISIIGSVWAYAGILMLVILASLGLGLFISGVSATDSQAVQYSMIVLLVSIFFTGFVLPLDQLAQPVQVVSFLLPATYGILALQDIVFRGTSVDTLIWAGLLAYTAIFAAAAWWAVRRDVVSHR